MNTKKKWDIVTGLDVCVDMILSGDIEPEFGQVEKLIDDYSLEMGGSCAIFACQCAKLGKKVLGLGTRGLDAFGELFEKKLLESGVDISRLKTNSEIKTGIGVALMKEDDRAILTYTGTINALDVN